MIELTVKDCRCCHIYPVVLKKGCTIEVSSCLSGEYQFPERDHRCQDRQKTKAAAENNNMDENNRHYDNPLVQKPFGAKATEEEEEEGRRRIERKRRHHQSELSLEKEGDDTTTTNMKNCNEEKKYRKVQGEDLNNKDDEGMDDENDDENDDDYPDFVPDQRVFCRDVDREVARPADDDDTTTNNNNDDEIQFYEAIIRKAKRETTVFGSSSSTTNKKKTKKSWSYLVHYLGWNARYDRWVPPSFLIPDNTKNRQRYEERKRQQQIQEEEEKQRRQQEENEFMMKQRRRKEEQRQQQQSKRKQQQQQTSTLALYETYCILPFTLKIVLVEEKERITRKGYDSPYGFDDYYNNPQRKRPRFPPRFVHHLPASITIRRLLNAFKKTKREQLEKKKIDSSNSDDQQQQQQKKKKMKKKQQQQHQQAIPGKNTTKVDNKGKEQRGEESTHDNNNERQESPIKSTPKKQQDNEGDDANVVRGSPTAAVLKYGDVREFCQRLAMLFEVALPVCLLYGEERPQYEYIKQHKNSQSLSLSEIYGSEHLLRLFVHLPTIIHATTMQNNNNNDKALNNNNNHRPFTTPLKKKKKNGSNNDDDDVVDNNYEQIIIEEEDHTILNGELITELITFLQQNRTACFKGEYRPPKRSEWLDWEFRMYGSNDDVGDDRDRSKKTQVDEKKTNNNKHKIE